MSLRVKCRICHGDTRVVFSQVVLRKYECQYLFCDRCGFLQTEEPYWLDEAYTSAIADADTGLVQRNLILSRKLSVMLAGFFDRNGRYLDIAGGYGMLTRLMRDKGFDFYWSDKYCKNLLAPGFEAELTDGPYTALTAFEVLEHVHDPVEFVRTSLVASKSQSIFFSTQLFDGEPPAPGAWWYYIPESGQHISFYQRQTLHAIAARLGLRCYSKGNFHLLTQQRIPQALFALLASFPVTSLMNAILKPFMQSKTDADHDAKRAIS